MANPEDPTPNAPPPAPLAGVKVVDLSRILAGPLCTMVLGDLGADVIKVERPGEGDDTRHWGPPFAGEDAAYFLSLNRNKRSVTADLGDAAGVALVRDLLSTADVLIENFRPGLMARFGLALDDLREAHPRLVTCSLTAFGAETGETASRPGYDIIVQAMSGLMSVTGERDGEPTKAGVALLDVISGLYAAVGVLAALRERDVTGRGRHVGVSLFDASVAAMVNQAANYLIGGVVPQRMGTEHPNIVPYQSFHAKDRPFILAAGNDRLFVRTCIVVGHPEWADDPRFATNGSRVVHRDELIPMLEDAFAQRTHAGLARRCWRRRPCRAHRSWRWTRCSHRRRAPASSSRSTIPCGDCSDWWRTRSGSTAWRRRRACRRRCWASTTRRCGETSWRERTVTAADRWRERLGEWAIPDEIVANAPESPWGFATECFRRRGEAAPDPEPTPTTRRALEALPEGGTVLDVGVGGGATSLPLAGRAGSIVGIDQQPDMLEGFLANAAAAGVEARAVTGAWPDAAVDVEPADVVVAGHVFYNIPELEPFARALDAHARRRVVVELTRAASARLDERPVAPVPRPRTARRTHGGRRRRGARRSGPPGGSR